MVALLLRSLLSPRTAVVQLHLSKGTNNAASRIINSSNLSRTIINPVLRWAITTNSKDRIPLDRVLTPLKDSMGHRRASILPRDSILPQGDIKADTKAETRVEEIINLGL